MNLTLLDEIFGDAPVRRMSVPSQGTHKVQVPDRGVAIAIGKISKRLTALEKAPLSIEKPATLPIPIPIPIVPIANETETKKEEKIGENT